MAKPELLKQYQPYPPPNELGATICVDRVLAKTEEFALVLRALVRFRRGCHLLLEAFPAPGLTVTDWNRIRNFPDERSDNPDDQTAWFSDEEKWLKGHWIPEASKPWFNLSRSLGGTCSWEIWAPVTSGVMPERLRIEWFALPGSSAEFDVAEFQIKPVRAGERLWPTS